MKPRRSYYNSTSFLDLLFNILLLFVLLFVISFIQIRPEQKEAAINTNAEFVITVTWDNNSKDDVDVWLQDPTNGVLYFSNKEMNLSHLDRDDVGIKKDMIILPNGELIEVKINQEMVTIRGFIPGEWVLNLHMYAKRDELPITVKVQIDKIKPKVKTIFFKEIVLTSTGEEITVTRFEMTSNGDILSFDDLPKKIVRTNKYPGSGGM